MKRTATFIGALAFAFTSIAEDMTFPLNGGYLDSATDWGGVMPSSSDGVQLDKPGVYRISKDVVFNILYIASGGITNDFGEHKISFVNRLGVRCTNGIYKVFSGGKYSTGDFDCNFSPGSKNGEVLFTNECEVVCTNMFYSAQYVNSTTTKITDGSKVYTKDLRIQNNSGFNNELVVSGGGEVHVSNQMYFEANVGDSAEGSDGFNRMKVEGDGSLYRLTSTYMVKVGQKFSNDLFLLTDGARADSVNGGVDLGGVNTTNAQLIVENRALAEFKKVKILSKNLFAVDTCATAVVSEVEFAKSDSMMKVSGNACAYLGGFSISGSGNTILVSDSTLVASNKNFRTTLGSSASSSNNVLRICGASSMVKLDASAQDIFGNGHHNTLSIEDGAEVGIYLARTMTNTHHSTISITGPGSKLDSGTAFYLGDKDNTSARNFTVSNTVYVGDGAVLDAKRILFSGTDNRLVVSNATINMTNPEDSVGLCMGRWGVTPLDVDCGNRLILQGNRPKVTSQIEKTNVDRFTFKPNNKSILRFEIPEEGWEKGHVAIDIKGRFTFGGDATLEIDCEDFVAKTGGRLHLIKAGQISEDSANTLKKVVLPEGATLEVSDGNVYLKSPLKVGFVFSVR